MFCSQKSYNTKIKRIFFLRERGIKFNVTEVVGSRKTQLERGIEWLVSANGYQMTDFLKQNESELTKDALRSENAQQCVNICYEKS